MRLNHVLLEPLTLSQDSQIHHPVSHAILVHIHICMDVFLAMLAHQDSSAHIMERLNQLHVLKASML
jgi:Na+/H+ antiporter NhaA